MSSSIRRSSSADENQQVSHDTEVILRVDRNTNGCSPDSNRRTPSRELWPSSNQNSGASQFSFPHANVPNDPPSRLISDFLSKQRNAGGDVALDMDLDMEELNRPPLSKDLRVSFQEPSPDAVLRRRSASGFHEDSSCPSDAEELNKFRPRASGSTGEVLRCTSNAHRRPPSRLLTMRTRSRLVDPPPPRPSACEHAVNRSGILPSGLARSTMVDNDDDDDIFDDDDIPIGFNRSGTSTVIILEWVSLFLILVSLICSLLVPALKTQTVWNLHLWKWEVLMFVLICGRLVSGWLIRLVVFSIERSFLLRKRVLYFVYAVRRAVRNCVWLGLVLLTWLLLFDKRAKRENMSKTLPYVTKVLVCLLVATAFRLLKTLLVKVMASSFHVSTYFDRIRESLFNQYVIETLSGPPLVEALNAMEDDEKVMAEVQKLQNAGATVPADLKAAMFSRSGRVVGGSRRGMQRNSEGGKSVRFSCAVTKREEGITIDQLRRLNQNNVSAWNMKRLMKIVRHGMLMTLDEHIADAGMEDEATTEIQSEYEAKAASKKIFINVVRPGAKYINVLDLMRFLREEEVIRTMSLFDGAQETRKISKSALKNWVVNAFRERRALALSLSDTKTAVKKLHHMVDVVVGIIVLILWLLILEIADTHALVLLSSQFLLAVFIFGNSCKLTFEAIIFLFVMHPFDVGDRCEVDGVQMTVEEMNIWTTIFLKGDGQKITYPNSLLSTKVIGNFYRSPDMGESIDFCIHALTPVEKIALMKDRIKRFIESKQEHWYPNPTIMLRDVEDMNRLNVSVWFQHQMNHQDMGERWIRRELVLEEMLRIFKELNIEYRGLPLDVNVRSMPVLPSSQHPSTWAICS